MPAAELLTSRRVAWALVAGRPAPHSGGQKAGLENDQNSVTSPAGVQLRHFLHMGWLCGEVTEPREKPKPSETLCVQDANFEFIIKAELAVMLAVS